MTPWTGQCLFEHTVWPRAVLTRALMPLLHLAEGFGFKAVFMRRKSAAFGCSQPAETRVVLFCLAEREWLWHVARKRLDGCQSLLIISHLPPLTICLSVCHSVCLVSCQTAANKVRSKRSISLSGVSCTWSLKWTWLKFRPTLSPKHTPMQELFLNAVCVSHLVKHNWTEKSCYGSLDLLDPKQGSSNGGLLWKPELLQPIIILSK